MFKLIFSHSHQAFEWEFIARVVHPSYQVQVSPRFHLSIKQALLHYSKAKIPVLKLNAYHHYNQHGHLNFASKDLP